MLKSTEVDWRFLAIFSHLQMTLAIRRELKFPADKRFRVKLTPMGMFSTAVPYACRETLYL
ncbi:MAG: hypothetical protein V7L31_07225 [Nostoc sp.]|uniref:hypothetical protein n=1 Tax=Nostoc sp. TaxID=1180 RepID=UPI002FF0D87F